MSPAQHAATKNEWGDSLVWNLPLAVAFVVEAQNVEAGIVRGIPRRIGISSLRDLIPFGVFGDGRTKRRLWTQWRVGRPGIASANDPLPDRHVLDYRVLEGLRLVFGEIYADH